MQASTVSRAIAREQLAEAPHAELAAGDLRAQIAQRGLGKAQIVVDDLPERLVALAGLVDLERAELQALLIDSVVATEPKPSRMPPISTQWARLAAKADHLAVVEARRVDHDVVEVLPADQADGS